MNQKEENRIRRLLEELDSSSEYENEISHEADSNEEDHVEFQTDCNSEEEFESDQDVENDEVNFFIGKDKKTKWRKSPMSKNIRTRARNIVTQKSGVKGIAGDAKTPLEIWKLFFSDSVIDIIVINTNKYIESIAKNYTRERDAKPTDKVEVETLLGLLLFAGVRKNSRLHVRDLFQTDGSSPEIFRLAMSWTRFSFLLKCLCFDDKNTR